jgi:hypothetical protein
MSNPSHTLVCTSRLNGEVRPAGDRDTRMGENGSGHPGCHAAVVTGKGLLTASRT